MRKTLLLIMLAIALVFGTTGVTVAAAQRSQSNRSFYPVRNWSTESLHLQAHRQIHVGKIGQLAPLVWGGHEREEVLLQQHGRMLDLCHQEDKSLFCGFDHEIVADHEIEHKLQGQKGIEHRNDETHHSHESDHAYNGHD